MRCLSCFVTTTIWGTQIDSSQKILSSQFPVLALPVSCMESKKTFFKYNHVIYRWKGFFMLIQNHNRTWVQISSLPELFPVLCLKSCIINEAILDFGNSEMGEKSLNFLAVSGRYISKLFNHGRICFLFLGSKNDIPYFPI